jgi:cbb3-type cytochrome oxidase maturation protein
MSVVIILMLASLAVGLVFVGAFVWSVRSGQYEDTLTPSLRVLLDDATTQVHSQQAEAIAAPIPVSETSMGAADRKKPRL